VSDDEQAIRDLVAAWLDASGRGAVADVLPLMAEDAVFLGPGRPPMRGRAAFAAAFHVMAACGQRVEARGDIQEILIAGDFAMCWNNLTMTVTAASGASVQMAGPALSVLRKGADGAWVIIRDANMVTPV
jgi:uncharacterized protein (TIGR02246 family)